MRKIKNIVFYLALSGCFTGHLNAQAPPPPPGGPGVNDPPIGGTLPVDDGLMFLLIAITIYSGIKIYQFHLKQRKINKSL